MGIALIAFGGFVLMEGVVWACFPSQMRNAYRRMMEEVADRDLHIVGLVSVFVGAAMLAYGVKLLN